VTGNISSDPDNHERMVRLRQAKIAGIAKDIPPVDVDDPDGDAPLLVIGWGSTEGSIKAAVQTVRANGRKVAQANLTHLNPFPANLGEVLARYPKVLVPEMTLGQLVRLLRAEYLVDARSYTKVQGLPFRTDELAAAIEGLLDA
jgi:2-oxoglutarate ferredoxin oxidoreductase subunit alpha